jgi:hypothetical protein
MHHWSPRLATILVLGLATPALADPLTGMVVDAETSTPVAGATLSIADDGNAAPVQSQEDGSFRFDTLTPGPVDLLIVAPGYEPLIQTATVGRADAWPPEPPILIVLSREGAQGEVIVVTDRAPRPQAAGSQMLLSQDLARVPGSGNDALAAVRSLPGVITVNGPAIGGTLVIRGGAPEDSKVTLDGITIPNAYHVFGNTTIVPTSFIESLEFTPGGFGAEEGRATGGVVALSSGSAVDDPAGAAVSASFLEVGATGQTPLGSSGRFAVSGGIRRSTIDLILPVVLPDDADVSFTTAPTYWDAQLRVDGTLSEHDRVALVGIGSYDHVGLISEDEDSDFPSSFSNESSFGRAIASWRHERESVKNRLVLALGQDRADLVIGAGNYVHTRSTTAQLRDDLRWSWARGQIRAGAEGLLDWRSVDSRAPLPPAEGQPPMDFDDLPVVALDAEYDAHTAGGYVAADLDLTATTQLTPGVRVDYFAHQDQAVLQPRVQLQQKLGPVLAKAAAGRYARGPDLAEGVASNLDVETATQYVLGAETRVAPAISLSASGFYTDRDDLVVTDPAAAMDSPEGLPYRSSGQGRSMGVEALLRVERGGFFGWVAYTVSRAERQDRPGEDYRLFDYDQTHNASLLASYRRGPWLFSGRWQFATGTPYTEVVGATYMPEQDVYQPIYGALNGARLEASHELDVRVERQWRFQDWSLAAFLDVSNVYQNASVMQYQYNEDYTERKAITEFIPPPSIGLRGEF